MVSLVAVVDWIVDYSLDLIDYWPFVDSCYYDGDDEDGVDDCDYHCDLNYDDVVGVIVACYCVVHDDFDVVVDDYDFDGDAVVHAHLRMQTNWQLLTWNYWRCEIGYYWLLVARLHLTDRVRRTNQIRPSNEIWPHRFGSIE